MDKNKEITKLEEEKEALQKKIDNLKKSTGQLQFEEWFYLRNVNSSINFSGQCTFDFGIFEISFTKRCTDESYYKNLLIACEALERITTPTIAEEN